MPTEDMHATLCNMCGVEDIEDQYYELKIRHKEITEYITLEDGEKLGIVSYGKEIKYKICPTCLSRLGIV